MGWPTDEGDAGDAGHPGSPEGVAGCDGPGRTIRHTGRWPRTGRERQQLLHRLLYSPIYTLGGYIRCGGGNSEQRSFVHTSRRSGEPAVHIGSLAALLPAGGLAPCMRLDPPAAASASASLAPQ